MENMENMENTGIQQQQKSLQKLRNNAEEDRKKRIKIIVTHRELLLKELFTMTGEGVGLDGNDHVISFLKGGDVTQVDQDKWGVYLDKHKISNVKLNMVKQESTSPSPRLDDFDPSKKLSSRRMPPPAARMVTRGVSGAVRPKSVDEILSSLDQKDLIMPSSPSPREKSSSPTHRNSSKPILSLNTNRRTTTNQLPPQPPRIVTTVNTNRPLMDSKSMNSTTYNGVKLSNTKNENHNNAVDLYAWQLRATHFPLYKQLQTARKTLNTHDWMLARDELKSVKTIQKIESLKKKNLWSLRQLKQHKSAPRTKTHWDSVLDEMKWMKTDFKQERKWKMAMAYMTAETVMEWHRADNKSTVCIKTRVPEPISLPTTPVMIDEQVEVATPLTEYTTTVEEMGTGLDTTNEPIVEQPQLLIESTTVDSTSEYPLKTDAMMGVADTVDPILKIETDMMNNMDTADESSMPTTPNFTTPTVVPLLSSDIIQEYRNIVKDFDPNMPILTLSIEDFGEFDANALFPDILTYEPPNPNFNDFYFNELEYGRITPITKLVSQHILLKAPQRYSRKRDIDGNPIIYQDGTKDYKSDIKVLPRHERYDSTPLISPLFAPKRLKDTPAQQPSTPQVPANLQTLVVSHWSEDDDVCLISFIIQYSFNWDLVCDALNSVRLPITGIKRTPWECHDRWKRNNLTSLSGQVSSAYTSKLKRELNRRPVTIRFDSPTKCQRQFSIFEAIKKTQKKREESEKYATTTAPPPRPTIEIHGTNSSGQRLPSAMEMSMHKAQRERQMAQAVLEQRQLSAAISLGSQQTPNGVPRSVAVPPQHQAQQARPPMSVATSAAAVARSAAQAASVPASSPVSQKAVRPQQQQNNNSVAAGGLPLNRYPAAQLQLLRQQQMVLMAAAQQQAQQQAAANGGQVRPSPPTPATIQRFANAIQASQQQQQQVQAQQQLQQLQLQQAQQQQPTHTPAPSAETVAQQVSQMTPSPSIQQSSPQQQCPPTQPTSSPQQQAQQQAIAAQLQAAQADPLMFAARLAQMGYPINQLPANQQLQLQRYLAQLQMRNAALAAANNNNNNNNNGGGGGSPVQGNTNVNLQAALLAQQQLQRLQQVQQAQQALQMQQQQQAQKQQQQQQQPPSQ